MKRSSGPRKTAYLSESVHQQLNMYALAATAAGVGMLALARPVEAKIIYTATHRAIRTGLPGILQLDLNHDGIADFKFENWWIYGRTDSQRATLSVLPSGRNGIRGYGGTGIFSFRFASALRAGNQIGPKDRFISAHSHDLMLRPAYGWGQWNNVSNRYLGLRFAVKGETHYGWARLNVHYSGLPPYKITAVLTGYAYETIPSKPIIAGKTKGTDDDDQPVPASLKIHTPEPAMLGMLALGAPGLSIWRRDDLVAATRERN